jgi:hypothetical protein
MRAAPGQTTREIDYTFRNCAIDCAPNLEQQGSIEPHLARLRTQPNTCAMASDDNYILDSDGNRILIGLTLDETREATHCDMPPNSA